MIAPGSILQKRYRIVRQLGKGGMGTVYEAIDERLGSTVALKETLCVTDGLRKQFEREARLLAKLHHPALPNVSDHFIEGDGQFLVMQFIEGEDLESISESNGGRIPQGDVLKWAGQLLDALDYIHSQNPPVIHRDIKPQNLKPTARGQIILLDFGLAKGYAGQTAPVSSIFGFTRMYAPLEQIQGTGTDHRSDLYSLAVTLYQLLTGIAPPDSLCRVSATTNGEADPLRPAHELNNQVSPSVSDVLSKAMALARAHRFASAIEMRRALNKEGLPETILDIAPKKEMAESKNPRRWDEDSFFDEVNKHLNPNELNGLGLLYKFSVERANVTWGHGIREGTFNAKFAHIHKRSLYSVSTKGNLQLNFAWLTDTPQGAETAKRFVLKLKQLRGFNIPDNVSEKYVSVPPARWINQVGEFMAVVDAVTQTDTFVGSDGIEEDEQTIISDRVQDEAKSKSVVHIDEPVIAININQQFSKSKDAEDLYHATRGMWRLNRQRAGRAQYAFAVYQGIIKEVYKINRWIPASKNTLEYWDERTSSQGKHFPSEVNDGRSEFIGELASEAVRKKYIGRQIPERHSQNPIRYFNC